MEEQIDTRDIPLDPVDTSSSVEESQRVSSRPTESESKVVPPIEQPEEKPNAHEELPEGFDRMLNLPKDRTVIKAPEEPESFDAFLERMGVDTEELMSDEEKEAMFGDAIVQMEEIAKERGITLPDNILSRIHVLDIKAFESLFRKNANTAAYGLTYGVTFPNRHTALNYWDIKGISSERNPELAFATLLKKFGIHELWHSVQQKDSYQRTDGDEKDWYGTNPPISRRDGMRIKGVTWNNVSEGMDLLNEGYVDYLAETTMERLGITPGYSPYTEQVGIIRTLITDIDESPFTEAAFHTDGICDLSTAMDKKFGVEALPQIALRLKADSDWRAEGYQYSKIAREYLTNNRKRSA